MSTCYQLREVFYQYPESDFKLRVKELEIKPGERLALVGANGSGKTTLLLLLSFLKKPGFGKILFFGQNPWESFRRLINYRRQIIFIPHQPYLFRGKVYDNLVLGLRLRKIPQARWNELLEPVVEIFSLDGLWDKKVSELSAGEAQRLALARALAPKPKVLLLDEPTVNLDETQRSRLESGILETNRLFGTTIIFTTHNFSQAHRLSQRILYLSSGRIVEYSHENYFSGRAHPEGEYSWIEPAPGQRIWFKGAWQGHINCVVSPEDFELLPLEAEPGADGLNTFSGKVVRLELEQDGKARIRISGKLDFRVIVDRRELEQKNIGLASPVLIRFSPDAVKVFE